MYSLAQQPDPAKFNFNKVDKSKEQVFVFKNLDSSAESLLLINVSPIDKGHCLLVPNVEKVLPQQVQLGNTWQPYKLYSQPFPDRSQRSQLWQPFTFFPSPPLLTSESDLILSVLTQVSIICIGMFTTTHTG